jgi:hypothetical protein
MNGSTSLFGAWLVSPWLFAGGTLLVSAPIIIHLLNKRKFKTVDWAAMDFLVEADKRNRRRIRLEDLLLLLLRCTAVVLIALLVARPFLPLTLAGGPFDSVRFDRIVLLDDSPSMEARTQGSSPWQAAKHGLIDFVTGLTAAGSDDSLTLFLASQPHRPIFNGLPINDETVTEITEEIKQLETSDLPAGFEAVLSEIEKTLDKRSADMNRVVYVVSDMRQRDWAVGQAASPKGMLGTLQRVARRSVGCFLVDVAGDEVDNLAVTRIVSQEKVLAAGVASRFEVTVRNMGQHEVDRVQVDFTAGDSLPLRGEIDGIPAGSTASIPFTYTFARPEDTPLTPVLEPVPIRTEISVEGDRSADRLAADNVRYYAARVVRGVPTLIVDGDPSATYGRSESFFLERALAPPGEFLSGIAVNTVTDADFETIELDPYQVIYLCNVYRLSEERRNALETWVKSGGGLVVALGDQVDEEFYNQDLYRDGKGLLPLRLEATDGDENEQNWVYFDADASNHPVARVFEGENNPFIEGVKIFRWWRGSLPEEELRAGRISCTARLTDGDKSPAIVEKTVGDGRVLVLTTAIDTDWGSWPADPSYLITMQELSRYMARKTGDEGSIVVGRPIRHPLDLTKYRMDVSIKGPGPDRIPIQPSPGPDQESRGNDNESRWLASYDETARRGFYEMTLNRTDGEPERILFAANLDVTEGNLRRVDQRLLRRDLGEAPIKIVQTAQLGGLVTEGAKGELWPYVLGVLVVVLCGEQFLGWLFGLRR